MSSWDRVEALIREHFARRPLMRATDVYKLLYQGVFGVAHIMGDDAWNWLEAEAEKLDLDNHLEEPLLEDVSADSSIVRVNLRPYLRRSLPLNKLFSAMKETVHMEVSPEELFEAWAVFKGLVISREVHIDLEEFEALDWELQKEGCRLHHHSEVYREAYHPAYRVVRRNVLDKMLSSILNK
jgi:hypothetical protein